MPRSPRANTPAPFCGHARRPAAVDLAPLTSVQPQSTMGTAPARGEGRLAENYDLFLASLARSAVNKLVSLAHRIGRDALTSCRAGTCRHGW